MGSGVASGMRGVQTAQWRSDRVDRVDKVLGAPECRGAPECLKKKR